MLAPYAECLAKGAWGRREMRWPTGQIHARKQNQWAAFSVTPFRFIFPKQIVGSLCHSQVGVGPKEVTVSLWRKSRRHRDALCLSTAEINRSYAKNTTITCGELLCKRNAWWIMSYVFTAFTLQAAIMTRSAEFKLQRGKF